MRKFFPVIAFSLAASAALAQSAPGDAGLEKFAEANNAYTGHTEVLMNRADFNVLKKAFGEIGSPYDELSLSAGGLFGSEVAHRPAPALFNVNLSAVAEEAAAARFRKAIEPGDKLTVTIADATSDGDGNGITFECTFHPGYLTCKL